VPASRPDPLTAALAACERITDLDREVGAFVAEPDRRARLVAAAEALARVGNPDAWPLFAVPAGVKDVMRTDGLATRAGSRVPAELLAGPQAQVVTRLCAAGGLVAGKTVTAEFATLTPGPTRNPRNLAHTPGGSSSGSAAAVAAGMVPLALGTQTIASVIRPAAYCGVPGFRPSYGRVPTEGIIAFAPSLDTVGWFAPDVVGLKQTAAVLCDRWQPAAPAGSPVLGVPVGPYLACAHPWALAAFSSSIARLRSDRFTIREVAVMEDFAAVQQALFVITRYELAREHAGWFARYGELYQPQTAAMIRDGKAITAAEYARALARQADLRDELAQAMQGIDAWITPAATGPAPAGLSTTGDPVMSIPWSLAGLPAVSIPSGLVDALPVGLQCVGRIGGDERLLAAAVVIEAALAATAS
jgi:Asp-tRNA(Asn)/Glu-tRNA(Gln) amidotransferase A subunit family amidase